MVFEERDARAGSYLKNLIGEAVSAETWGVRINEPFCRQTFQKWAQPSPELLKNKRGAWRDWKESMIGLKQEEAGDQ